MVTRMGSQTPTAGSMSRGLRYPRGVCAEATPPRGRSHQWLRESGDASDHWLPPSLPSGLTASPWDCTAVWNVPSHSSFPPPFTGGSDLHHVPILSQANFPISSPTDICSNKILACLILSSHLLLWRCRLIHFPKVLFQQWATRTCPVRCPRHAQNKLTSDFHHT